MHSFSKFVKTSLATAFLGSLSMAAMASPFKVTEITNVPSGATPVAINSSGEVVLNTVDGNVIYWKNGIVRQLNQSSTGRRGRAVDINDSGVIVGDSFFKGVNDGEIFYWSSKDADPLVVAPDNIGGYIVGGINNDGIIAGTHLSPITGCGNLPIPFIAKRDPNFPTGTGFDIKTTGKRSKRGSCYAYSVNGVVDDGFMYGHETSNKGWGVKNIDGDGYLEAQVLFGNADQGLTVGFHESQTNTNYIGYRGSDHGFCHILTLQNNTNITHYSWGLKNKYCKIDTMNRNFAFGVTDRYVNDNPNNGVYRYTYVHDRVLNPVFGFEDLTPLQDFHSLLVSSSAGWQVKQFHDANVGNQVIAVATRYGGAQVPVLIEETVPDAPASPGASKNGNSVTLSVAGSPGADYYVPYFSKNGGAWQSLPSFSGLQTSHSNLTPGNYQYRVKACSNKGCSGQSVTSITVNIPEPTPQSPNTPTATVSGTSIYIDWNDVAGATHYYRQVSINGGGWQNSRYFAVSQAAYHDQLPRSYRYRVQACNASGCSAFSQPSASVEVKVVPAVLNKPTATVTGTTIHIDWNDVPHATKYYRQVRINYGSWQNRREFIVSQATYHHQLARTYQYRVQACNANGCSAYSAASDAVTVR